MRLSENNIESIDDIVSSFIKKYGAPFLNLTITKGEERLLSKEYCQFDTADESSDKNGIFMLSSIVKTMTAHATVKLVENSSISLESRVLDILPELVRCSNIDRSIRVIDLLGHTACINKVAYSWSSYTEHTSRKGVLESFSSGEYHFSIDKHKSGEWMYSNVGYDILGALIEKESGIDFDKFMSQQILEPLGMFQTKFDLEQVDTSRLRTPTLFENGEVLPLGAVPNVRRHNPSAVVFSSADDLSKWAMFNATKGEAEKSVAIQGRYRDSIWTPRAATKISYCPLYGLGWFLSELNGNFVVGHGGREFGYNTLLLVFPDSKVSMCVLMNTHKADVIRLAIDIMRVLIKAGVLYNKLSQGTQTSCAPA